ncbi:uncharacterized protein LOC100880662 [Megachile rotundata]|uniref:uncharacterized protein LOC100880662 n=1 Tax=Megachile rotundata TaxID=143995 RepID=UPI000258D422|nr:PREDICTED: gametocyte-specific factor 1-like [Megachile rotundata]XP_012150019.1 PREDICTED: gametocyte-specific factor 1-like [Megachile rotundata]
MYNCLKLTDPVVICPYNNKHVIVRSRLQNHIVKCEKNYPEHYKIMCPYNATHRLFKNELTEHIITCSTRNVLESEMYPAPRKHGNTSFALNSEISSTIDCTENWDIDNDNTNTSSIEDKDFSTNNMEPQILNANLNSKDNIEKKVLRAPRGFSEAMLREVNEESCVDDVESITSSLGIGRGKGTLRSDQLKLIGLGRGKPLNNDI